MSSDQMTREERVRYHVTRVREILAQAQDPQAHGTAWLVLDSLAYDHAKDAAHAAGERGER